MDAGQADRFRPQSQQAGLWGGLREPLALFSALLFSSSSGTLQGDQRAQCCKDKSSSETWHVCPRNASLGGCSASLPVTGTHFLPVPGQIKSFSVLLQDADRGSSLCRQVFPARESILSRKRRAYKFSAIHNNPHNEKLLNYEQRNRGISSANKRLPDDVP